MSSGRDLHLRTPFLDCFKRGEVDRDLRRLAAAGDLAPRAHEQLGLLLHLLDDPDPEIQATAERTLDLIPRERLASFLARSDVPADLKAAFARRGVQPLAPASTDPDTPLVDHSLPLPPADGSLSPEERRFSVTQRISRMSITERIKTAMKGTREERAVLIRDPNKIVAAAVLSSPKLSEAEVESIAKMASVSDEVLRIIGTHRSWIRHYSIIAALARNPKTPVAVSLGLVSRLNDRDVRMLATDRNVPEPIRVAARKLAVATQARRQ
ncbi:MAG: hypothetical protein HY654_13570 [Acidobacteria bacterium]|nr:hypothetical protein [Acidobacteriota bacterium]